LIGHDDELEPGGLQPLQTPSHVGKDCGMVDAVGKADVGVDDAVAIEKDPSMKSCGRVARGGRWSSPMYGGCRTKMMVSGEIVQVVG